MLRVSLSTSPFYWKVNDVCLIENGLKMLSGSQLISSRNICLTEPFKACSVNRKHSTNQPSLKTREKTWKKNLPVQFCGDRTGVAGFILHTYFKCKNCDPPQALKTIPSIVPTDYSLKTQCFNFPLRLKDNHQMHFTPSDSLLSQAMYQPSPAGSAIPCSVSITATIHKFKPKYMLSETQTSVLF